MRKALLLCSVLLIPLQVFAVSNLRLNGVSDYTVTTLPADVIMTCDIAQPGNEVEMEIYIDANNSGTIDANDIVAEFMVLTDGIGWIRDPDNPDKDIAGDETPVDGTLQSTATFESDDYIFFDGRLIIKLTDEDASTATASLRFDVQLLPPLITGKVTDASTGTFLQDIIVLAERDIGEDAPESGYGLTDANGDYSVKVEPGTWKVAAFDFVRSEYMSSDTMNVTVGEGETKILNFQLQKYNSFVEGTTKKEDGTPVPGIQIIAANVASFKVSFGSSDQSGYYKLGVEPGEVEVMANVILNMVMAESQWPEGYYVDPAVDTVTVVSGQTKRVDFVFKPYGTFIEGDCMVEGGGKKRLDSEGLAGVQITAMTMNLQTMEFHMSATLSDDQGHYRIGVLPGTVSLLLAYIDGYALVKPVGGYMEIDISEGQTLTGKDFTFSRTGGEMSISGQVTYDNGIPANNVYVAAVLDGAQCRLGYRLTYTDADGNYQFDDLLEGSWKVGVYKEGYGSTPAMMYEFLVPGTVQKVSPGISIGRSISSTVQAACCVHLRFGHSQRPRGAVRTNFPGNRTHVGGRRPDVSLSMAKSRFREPPSRRRI